MNGLPDILFWTFLSVASLYAVLLLMLMAGWLRLPLPAAPAAAPLTRLSVIIAARNEEGVIGRCLRSVAAQDYPPQLFEVIVVDDASTDGTVKEIEEAIKAYPACRITLLQLADQPGVVSPKKRAITEAVKVAAGELIVLTDADCTMKKQWLSSVAAFYDISKAKMIIAPVSINGGGLFANMQALEFCALMGVTGGSAARGRPLMCNGANLAYERKVFNELGGYDGTTAYASGDDVMLMHKVNERYPGSVAFLKSGDAIVSTAPQPAIAAFFSQRKRWASKARSTGGFLAVSTALFVLISNLLVPLSAGLAVVYGDFVRLFLVPVGIKWGIDFLFLLLSTSFFGKQRLLWLFLPVQLFYSCYVVAVACAGNTGMYVWKGRTLR